MEASPPRKEFYTDSNPAPAADVAPAGVVDFEDVLYRAFAVGVLLLSPAALCIEHRQACTAGVPPFCRSGKTDGQPGKTGRRQVRDTLFPGG